MKARLLTEILQLATARAFQIFLVSHDPTEALALCENAILLDGCLRETGTLRELVARSPWEPCLSFRKLQEVSVSSVAGPDASVVTLGCRRRLPTE